MNGITILIVLLVTVIVAGNVTINYETKWVNSLVHYLREHWGISHNLEVLKHSVRIKERIRFKIILMIRLENLQYFNINDRLLNRPHYRHAQASRLDLTVYFVEYREETSMVIDRFEFSISISGNFVDRSN